MVASTFLDEVEVPVAPQRRFTRVRVDYYDDLAAMMAVEHHWPAERAGVARLGDARKMARAA